MFALPAILFAISGISGAGGIALSIKSAIDSSDASNTNRMAQERNEKNLMRFEACSEQLDKALESLGQQRMIITKNFSVFVTAFEKIHNRPEFTQGEDTDFPEFNFDEIKNVSVVATQLLGTTVGAIGGSVLSTAAATGTTTLVMALGKASTGTRIATLHGAALEKAIYAALGGGAKAVGGGGIALGTMVLNATTLGVGVLVEGLAMAYAGSKAKKAADKAKNEMEKNEKIIYDAINMQLSITHSVDNIKTVSVEICNHYYKPLVMKMKKLVTQKTDWNEFTSDEKQLVENNILLVQILHYLNNTPLYEVTKLNDDGEVEEVQPNSKAVDEAIHKSRAGVKNIGG
jgi:hypothetical protein